MFVREGDERLSGHKNGNGSPSGGDTRTPAKKRKSGDKVGTVGRALRTVYDDMLREDVPKDFLDLLGKLD